LLITSYEQQERVLQAPVAGRMLAGLDRARLVGLALLPGPLRRMLGVKTDFFDAADFRGTRVGIQEGRVAEATMRALGATPVPLPAQARIDAVDGYEQQLASISGNN
jgi:TRAP-type C4-dicarboxylate transport system substrate-binding protein